VHDIRRVCETAHSTPRNTLTTNREDKVQQRRDAFERVETILDTRNTAKLPRCYASTSREELYDEGLRAGRAAFEDGLKHEHDFFLEATPRGILNNARYVIRRLDGTSTD
jgi:acyl-CoA oxidase